MTALLMQAPARPFGPDAAAFRTTTDLPLGDLVLYIDEWLGDLTLGAKSPGTIQSYRKHALQMTVWLAEHGRPTNLGEITKAHVSAFVQASQKAASPSTHHNRYRVLKVLFAWAVDQEHLAKSPMAGLPAPKAPEPKVKTPITPQELEALIAVARRTRSFLNVRDEAIVRLLWDSGGRRMEVGAALMVDHLDLPNHRAWVMGKGAKPRFIPFSRETAKALHRYLKARASHPQAAQPNLWLAKSNPNSPVGRRGIMTDAGITFALRRLARGAGISDLHPHRFRHTFASRYLEAGGAETELMTLCGWTSTTMLRRYSKATAETRALASYERLLG